MKQNQTFPVGHIQMWGTISFLSKDIKVFQWHLKWKFVSFMTKVNLHNGSETKLVMFSWDIFKTDTISFFIKNIKVFHGTYSNRTWFFTGHEILKYFNDFCNWHLNGIKGDMCKSNITLPYLQCGRRFKWFLKFIFW